MSFNRMSLKVIYKALSAGSERVSENKTWNHLNREYGIGRKDGNEYILSAQEHFDLRKIVEQETGLDLLSDQYLNDNTLSRTESARQLKDEKLLSTAVRSGHIEVRSDTGTVGNYTHSRHGYTGLKVDELLNEFIETIIVIENRDTFLSLSVSVLPGCFESAKPVYLYRGDNQVCPGAVKQYLEQTKASVFYFGDFDAKGLEIALAMPKVQGLILPDQTQTDSKSLQKLSKSDAFYAQQPSLLSLLNKNIPLLLREYLMLMNDWKLAVTQEHLIARHIPLVLLWLEKKEVEKE